ncbi:glycosyltransferase family 4 protein [Candidatus Uhrbacteria bacterium]|nr:glycosyltransferase family 4 protein [Candidatus Uhrbacteria bacterium]
MRILVDIRHLSSPEPSGIGEYTTQLLRALLRMDQTNAYTFLSSGRLHPKPPQEMLEHAPDDRIRFVHVNTPNKLLNLRTLLLGHPTLNWRVPEPIDLLFLPNLNIVSLPSDIPSVLTVHDLSWKFFPELYSRKMRLWHAAVRPQKLIASCAHLITPSASTKQDLVETFQVETDRVQVIPHGKDSTFAPKMEARDHGVRSRLRLPRRFALFVGTIEPRKNVPALIEAVHAYRQTTADDLHLVLCGKWGWNSPHVRHLLWRRDYRSWVHPIGYVPGQDRPALYRSAQVLLWPSLYEGFGLPILEAMASGLPVITSRVSSLPELTGGAAILIDPYNSVDLTEAIRELVQSAPLRQQMIQKGLQKSQDYSWEKSALQTRNLFEKII